MAVVWHLGAGYTAGVDYNSVSNASATSAVVNKPSGLADGMVLRAYFYSQVSAGAAATAPSGWTLEVAPTARRGGVYRKYIASAAAETATNYTWSTASAGRNALVIWLSEGEPTTANTDAVGAFSTEATTATAAAVTAVGADDLLATFTYWNNSTTTSSTVSYPGAMTKLIDLSSPNTANTSGIGIAIQQLSAAGSTGTRATTASPTPTNMSSVNILYKAVATAPSRTATLGVTLGGTAAAVEGGAIRTATAGVTLGGTAAAFELAQYPPQPFSVPDMDAWIAKGYPIHWAHRGGSANWSEMTMYAYDRAVAHGARCLEVSVNRSSDGVWIMSHDATLTRVTGNAITISSTNSSSMLGMAVTAPSGGGVIGRLEDVLDAYGDDKVILVDNKPGSFFTEFLDLLETYPNAHTQFIVKLDGQFGTLANFQAAQARGFKTAGYWYPNNYAANLPSRAPYTDYIGMQYDATSGEWADIFAYGKPVWGHVLQNSTQYNLCTAAGVDIYQVADVTALMPRWNVSYSTAGVTTSGSAAATGGAAVTATGGVTLGGTSTGVEREIAKGGDWWEDFTTNSPFRFGGADGWDTVAGGMVQHNPGSLAHRARYLNYSYAPGVVFTTRVLMGAGTPRLGGLAFVNLATDEQVIVLVDTRDVPGGLSTAGLQIREGSGTSGNVSGMNPSETIVSGVWYRITASMDATGLVRVEAWNDDTGVRIAALTRQMSVFAPFASMAPAIYSYGETDHDWFGVLGVSPAVTMGGTAAAVQRQIADATAGVTLGGTATGVAREVRTATAGVTLGGTAPGVQRQARTATLGVTAGGSVVHLEREILTATAGVTLGGTADAQASGGTPTRTATLDVTLGGSVVSVGRIITAAALTTVLAGTATASGFGGSFTRTASAGVTLSGTATASGSGGSSTRTATLGVTLSGAVATIAREVRTATAVVTTDGSAAVVSRHIVTAMAILALSGVGQYLPVEGFPEIPKARSIRYVSTMRSIRLARR